MKPIIFFLLLSVTVFSQNKVTSSEYIIPSNNSGAIKTVEYKDVYGQTVQTNAVKFSNNEKDVVTHIELDEFGRAYRSYLPTPTRQTSGAYVAPTSLKSTASSYYGVNYQEDEYFYSETQFEPTPFNRPLKQSAPGEDWRMGAQDGHEIEYVYLNNSSSDRVFNFSVTTVLSGDTYNPTLVKNGVYSSNQLTKTIIKDENHEGSTKNHTLEEYKNRLGQVVLKRTYSTVGNGTTIEQHDTYYVYDIYGNLSFVLPPLMPHHETLSILRSRMAELGYQYKYDKRNRLVEKKLPGKDWEYMAYDKQDRLVATKDAIFPWQFVAYDHLGRVLYTGQITGNYSKSQVQAYIDHLTEDSNGGHNNESFSNTPFSANGIEIYYTNNFLGGLNYEIFTVNYYDKYPSQILSTENITVPSNIMGQTVITETTDTNVKGLPTISYLRILDSNDWEKTFTFYDKKTRPIATHKINHLDGHTISENELDFRGKVVRDFTQQQRENNTDTWEVNQFYTYDHMERLTLQTSKVMDEPTEPLQSNQYDALGQLIKKYVGVSKASQKPLQKVDYKYNIRGWLTDINDTNDLADEYPLEHSDMFAFKISYNQPIDVTEGIAELYNGNISETYWRTAKDNVLRSYGYTYDGLNRLRKGFYRRPGTTHAYEGTYNESLSYDKNGNIKTLHRNGGFDMQGSLETMDDLSYTYEMYSNKLIKVTDPTSNTQGFDNGNSGDQNDYDYDLNGNMISDKNKEILNIKYNHLNLPVFIEFPTGKITYRYNAAGIKVEKKVRENDEIITDYMDGFQYLNGELQFISHAEGYINFAQIPGLQEFNKFTYVYNYTDHLGNVRLSYAENPKNLGNIVILEENNYYPFGLEHAGYNKDVKEVDFADYLELTNEELQNISEDELLSVVPVIKNKYKYKYQGQERQDELNLNWDSFKWRNYDYAIGRFMSVDPLAEEYEWQSVYSFSSNQPIHAPELEGKESLDDLNKALSNAIDYASDVVRGGVEQINSDLAQIESEINTFENNILEGKFVEAFDQLARVNSAPFGSIRIELDNHTPLNLSDGNEVGKAVAPILLLKSTNGKTAKSAISSRAARREVMRDAGIPTSQQPFSQSRNDSGREYTYINNGAYGVKKTKSVQQQTKDRNHDKHWEAGPVQKNPDGSTKMNNYGWPKLQNKVKSKVNYPWTKN